MEWPSDRVSQALSKAKAKFAKCRSGGASIGGEHASTSGDGTFIGTAIVMTDGSVGSAGISVPGENSEQVADCMIEVIRNLELPTTGSWPAKVSFEVP